jgi:sulfotransferase family protein
VGDVRIAMWSGPRNISTAMMRSFENREDTAVTDEPFYAHYLAATGARHAGAAEIVAQGETDWRHVAEQLTGPPPGGARVWYQKQMTHHMLPQVGREWFAQVTHCFLIRDPREVLLSYAAKMDEVTLDGIGVIQQAAIFDEVASGPGAVPPILDARDVLANPGRALGALCDAVGIPFTDRMLSWPAGPRASDGIWASHWYDAVLPSTSFAPPRPRTGTLPPQLESIAEACAPHYQRMHRLRIGG